MNFGFREKFLRIINMTAPSITKDFLLSSKLGPTGEYACPHCDNSFSNGIPGYPTKDSEVNLRNCANCKRTFRIQRYHIRFCIVQESGFQCGPPNGYESHIIEFIPYDDEEFGKQYVAKLNRKTDLPFYLVKVQVEIIGKMEQYTDERLKKEGIELLGD